MIVGTGIDLIELERIQKSLRKSNRLTERILTKNEMKIFNELQSERRRIEFLAGRFAAKEAYAKAVGTGIGKLSFQHIEILKNQSGAPIINVHGHHTSRTFISITHSKAYAIAQVIIEK